jgi:aubergine-like protein
MPKLVFMVLKKKVSSRFFEKDDYNQFQNPTVGTVINERVVKNKSNEFFLISQEARQGTVNPTHFHILANENTSKIENLQKLTFILTHMYYNWAVK